MEQRDRSRRGRHLTREERMVIERMSGIRIEEDPIMGSTTGGE
jgi:hypothetical protein